MGGDKLGFARGKKARRPAQSEPAFFILGFIFGSSFFCECAASRNRAFSS